MKSSTATTVSTESSKQTGNSSNIHTPSDILEQQTDPTSSPSEMLDEPDRKDTESPIDSDRAVYGSNSVHSDSSDSSTDHSDSKKNMTTAVGLEKVGGQFDESCSGREAASFHNPANDVEAKYINDKVIKANSEHFTLSVWPLVTDRVCSYNGGHLPSSRSTFPRSRSLVSSLRETQRARRTGSGRGWQHRPQGKNTFRTGAFAAHRHGGGTHQRKAIEAPFSLLLHFVDAWRLERKGIQNHCLLCCREDFCISVIFQRGVLGVGHTPRIIGCTHKSFLYRRRCCGVWHSFRRNVHF